MATGQRETVTIDEPSLPTMTDAQWETHEAARTAHDAKE